MTGAGFTRAEQPAAESWSSDGQEGLDRVTPLPVVLYFCSTNHSRGVLADSALFQQSCRTRRLESMLAVAVLDDCVSYVYTNLLRASPLFRHDSWEPALVVVSWALFTLGWYLVDTRLTWLHVYRIQKVADDSHWVFEGFHRCVSRGTA